MTREEAVKVLLAYSPSDSAYEAQSWLDAFEKLGMLKLGAQENLSEPLNNFAAVAQLENKCIMVCAHVDSTARITTGGAAEIINILTKAGFRITRDPQ